MAAAEFRDRLRTLLDQHGWTVPDLARHCSYSRQYVWEVATGRKRATGEVARAFDAALRAGGSLLDTVTEDDGTATAEGDSMRRRTVLAGASAAVGGALTGVAGALLHIDSANAAPPVADVRAALAQARGDFAAVRLRQLSARLPQLISAVEAAREHATGRRREDTAMLAADVYRLTARLAVKLHEQGVAWAAVDRATRAARQSGCPRAVAQVARAATVVLRRSGDGEHARQVIVDAAHRLHTDTRLAGGRDVSLYAEMLAAAAYTAAVGDRRDEAWTYADEAGAALAGRPGPGFNLNELELYRAGVARLLGDYGQAVDYARRVRVDALPTPERQARFWEDCALAWWGRGRRGEAWEALREAERAAPQEVRYRPWARDLTSGLLATPGPQLRGLREFAARTGLG